MKNAKREYLMKKIAVAALMMGIYSPLAQAAISPKDGVSLEELSQIVSGLEIQKEGNTIRFAGTMPKRCAESVIPVKADYKDGKHLIKISMPACDQNFRPEATDEIVDAADYLNELKLKDANGEIMLMHYKAGSRLASDREQMQALPGKDGNALAHMSEASIKAQIAEEEQAERDREIAAEDAAYNKAKIARLKELEVKVTGFCKEGNFVGLGEEIEMATDLLGDVSELLEKVASNYEKSLVKNISKAASPEATKEAYEAFIAASAGSIWDEDAAKKAYIERRFELLDNLASDAKTDNAKLSEVDREIRDLVSELRDLDKGQLRERQATFAKVYAEIGTHAANKGAVEQAISYYDKAKEFTDAAGKIKMDGEAAKVYTKQFKDCLAKNPAKMEVCDQYRDQAKARATQIGDQLAANGSEDEVQNFKAEFISTFGGGVSVSAPGFGAVSPYQPGTFDQLKQQQYQQYQAQQQMQMYQQMMGIAQPTANAGSNFLGLK